MEKRKRSRHTAEFTSWHGVHPLVPLFCLWKFLLFSIVALAPGPGYDTSSTLLLDADATAVSAAKVQEVATSLPRVLKFVRWDAIYFSQITERGYLFEQEWAFGPGFPSLVDFLQKSISHLSEPSTLTEAEQAYLVMALMTRSLLQPSSEWPCQLFVIFFLCLYYTV